jgi:hypothetical protein
MVGVPIPRDLLPAIVTDKVLDMSRKCRQQNHPLLV